MVESESSQYLAGLFRDSAAAHVRFAEQGLQVIEAAANAIHQATASGRKVLAFGNGGSAADAQHLSAELVGRFETERNGLAAIALSTDTSILTAVANDYGYLHVFSRQIEALGGAGDIAFGISTSGKSPNVQSALGAARRRGLVTIALTGRDGGTIGADAEIHINVAEASTARVQEVHRTILHGMCGLIDRLVARSAMR